MLNLVEIKRWRPFWYCIGHLKPRDSDEIEMLPSNKKVET